MTSGNAVERFAERSFRLRCPCGATIVTSKKTVACADCGKTIEIRQVRQHGESAIVVERLIERDFHFHCACGTTVTPSGRTATCSNCGQTLEIRRSRKHKHRPTLTPRGTQSVWQLRDLRKLPLYAALCALALCYLYGLACG
jgi:hypothetical protein